MDSAITLRWEEIYRHEGRPPAGGSSGEEQRRHIPRVLPSPRRAPPPPSARRGSTPRAGSTAARDEHLRQLATFSVARPVAVMVTRDRRHAAMIPARPRPFHAARHVSRPFLNDEHPQLGDDAEGRAGHRTVERVDEHGPEPVPEEEREFREDYPGDEDRSANRPQSAQKVLQGVIESRSKL